MFSPRGWTTKCVFPQHFYLSWDSDEVPCQRLIGPIEAVSLAIYDSLHTPPSIGSGELLPGDVIVVL